jgi:Ca2+-binding RTX toxin-like protein
VTIEINDAFVIADVQAVQLDLSYGGILFTVAYEVETLSGHTHPSLTNHGEAHVSSSANGGYIAGVDAYSTAVGAPTPLVNSAGALFTVTATGTASLAIGFNVRAAAAPIVNDGQLIVSAASLATGIQQSATVAVQNGGAITVSAPTARGVVLVNGGEFDNTGTVLAASSGASATGVRVEAGPTVVNNSGVITAKGSSDPAMNLAIDGHAGVLTLYNSGRIIGDVSLAAGAAHNSGSIKGDVHLGYGAEAYDGSGVVKGAIYGEGGGDTLTGGAHADLIYGDNTVWGAGSDGDDLLSGGAGEDVIHGGGGSDQLFGQADNDILDGGAGDDVLDGGDGLDLATYAGAPSGVVVNLGLTGSQNTGGAGVDTLHAIENLTGSAYGDTLTGCPCPNSISGGAGNDTLNGSGGDDVLDGGRDDDLLNGGAGADTLFGGAGHDTFVFSQLGDSTTDSADRIMDFGPGDHIDLHLIDADLSKPHDQAFHLGKTAGHAGDIVVSYSASSDKTTVSIYVDGDTVADGKIILSGDHHGLAAADFVL